MIKIVVQNEQYTAAKVFQWDLGQTLEIHGLELDFIPEVHFSKVIGNKIGVISREVIVGSDGVITVDIPSVLLETSNAIKVYVCKAGEDYFATLYQYEIVVQARPKPTDYIHTDEEILTWEKLEKRIEVLEKEVANMEGDGGVTEETDPTVPEWAKQPNKPTYTADEVGALPKDTTIPTKVSQLENDKGYLTTHQDISGKADKPTVIERNGAGYYIYEFYNNDNKEMRLSGSTSTIEFDFYYGEYAYTYMSGLCFDSGETPTSICYTNSGILNWVGADCTTVDGLSIFQPSANTHYDIVFYFNGTQFIGLVNGFVPCMAG